MDPILKYPRTPHLLGSALQHGDDDVPQARLQELANKYVVVEEKLDGANCGISFSPDGRLLLQSRGHFLGGGPREAQWTLFKSWAFSRAADLHVLLGQRYVLYGEWLYAKHSVWYTDLPHFFVEFDVWDHEQRIFLSTARRRALFADAPWLVAVPVIAEGRFAARTNLADMIGPSRHITGDVRARLAEHAETLGQDPTRVLAETDTTGLMEGLYLKVEDADAVVARYKYIRRTFVQTILDGGDHWHDRPLLPNLLAEGVTLF